MEVHGKDMDMLCGEYLPGMCLMGLSGHGHRTILYPGFIDPERCAHFVKIAKARLAPSGLALRKTEGPQETECDPLPHCFRYQPAN